MTPKLRSDAESTPAPSARVTTFAHGRYVVIRLLGEGGQKRVFLTHDTQLDRDVVIAVLKAGCINEEGMARLQGEARALARLGDHPHIVTVHDIGEEFGQPYIVTQFVDGGPLDALQKNTEKRQLPIADVLRVGREVCEALHHAHQQGIVHRDVKPGNIWLTKQGATKLGDFGLAVGLELSRVTAEGQLLGTVAYMAPEQALGQEVGPRADLYSLGVVLYEMVAGRRPFVGDTLAAVMSQHLHAAPVAPSWHNAEVSPALDTIILHLLAKAPQDRPASAKDVGEALSQIAHAAVLGLVAAAPKQVRPLDRLAGGVFVGRGAELEELRAGFDAALAGNGSVVQLVGEPGSGKTSIAEQLLTYAQLRGAQVLRSHCHEGEGAPAYWPWVQLLRTYVSSHPPEHVLSTMSYAGAAIVDLDPDIRRRFPDLTPGPPLEPEQARFRLFDSVTTMLKNASAVQPLVIFIDDLHWADAASLRLVQFLSREIRQAKILMIVTLRSSQFGPLHPLALTLGMLASQGLNRRVVLEGLTEGEVGRFIEMTTGTASPERLVSAVHQRTEGNPFFVKEVVRLLVAGGQLGDADATASWTIALPESVRDVITRRLGQVSQECNRVLATASVIGRDFDLGTLGRVGDIGAERLLDAIDEAMTALLITQSRQLGTCRFSHALVRETLYESMSANRRTRLHLRIGAALEEASPEKQDSHLAALAHHYFEAIPLGQADKAIDYAVRAGQRADRLLAYEEAASRYDMALRALDLKDHDDPVRRCELLLAQGAAQMKAGLSDQARESLTRAADIARSRGAAETFALAVLGLGAGTAARTRLGHAIDRAEISRLREALAGIGDAESPLRARLLAQLALALYHEPAERTALSLQAVEISRRLNDSGALLAALYSRCVSLEGFAKAEERLDLAIEIVRTAEGAGDVEDALRGHFRCYRELLELGNIERAERELATYGRLADRIRQPRYLWYVPFCKASLAAYRGEFSTAEQLVDEALAIGRRAHDPNAALFCTIVAYSCMYHRASYGEIEPLLKRFIDAYPSTSRGWRVQLLRLYCLMDRREEALKDFDALAGENFDDLPIDGSFVNTLVALAHVCRYLGDRRHAARIYARLQPYANFNQIAGNTGNPAGSVSHALGVAATTLGRWQEAESFFRDAIQRETRMGAKPWLVWTSCSYAQMLRRRRQPGDDEQAQIVLQQAQTMGRELGMNWVATQSEPHSDKPS